ncbi:unnamed protein product [Strongylus vulgaris]|uniref:Uncharacterized protein n=1 Tax=Strongylus vulgaris TaxID=40348 RepID=A0A3P7J5Y9_STRVU|nr:unnamed protein product [Strongylus vulgaris]
MLRFLLVNSVLILLIHSAHLQSSNSNYNNDVQKHIREGKEHFEQAAESLVDNMLNSMDNQNMRNPAMRDRLKDLAEELRPYLETKANMKSEQELGDLDQALMEAQNQMSQLSGTERYNKEAEIAKIRDEINRVRYELKERLQKIMEDRKNGVVMQKRDSLLPNMTGASSWQTATWILLALSILLTVAIIAMLMYQMSKKREYERLMGTRSM